MRSTASTAGKDQKMKTYVIYLLISLSLGILCCAISLALFAVIISSTDIPQAIISVMALVSVSICAIIMSNVLSRLIKHKIAIIGVSCAVIIYILTAILKVIIIGSSANFFDPISMGSILISSMIGALLGSGSKLGRTKSTISKGRLKS